MRAAEGKKDGERQSGAGRRRVLGALVTPLAALAPAWRRAQGAKASCAAR